MKSSSPFGFIGISLVSAALIIFFPSSSYAEPGDIMIDIFFGGAGGPEDEEVDFDLGRTFGGGFGLGYEGEEYIQYRIDLSYFNFSDDGTVTLGPPFSVTSAEIEQELQIVELFFGFRTLSQSNSIFHFFAELGVSANFLDTEGTLSTPSLGTFATKSNSGYAFGVVPGVGGKVWLSPKWELGVNARYHFIGDGLDEKVDASFLSGTVMVSYTL